jgi:hypothetical protein
MQKNKGLSGISSRASSKQNSLKTIQIRKTKHQMSPKKGKRNLHKKSE